MIHITMTVHNKWKPRVCEICKVFSHSCKAIVKAPTLLVEDMIKIKKKKNEGRNALQDCSLPIIIVDRVKSPLIAAAATKSIIQTDISGGISRPVQTC